MEGKTCIQLRWVQKKDSRVFQRKYCHPKMHPSDYPPTKSFYFEPDFVKEVEEGEHESIMRLCNAARERGCYGTYDVCVNRGGFNCRGAYRKMLLKQGRIDTSNKGLCVIARITVD